MHLSKQSIEEFRVIYAKEFGRIITEEEAFEMATRLVNLYQLIYGPLPSEHCDGATRPLGDHRPLDASFPNAE